MGWHRGRYARHLFEELLKWIEDVHSSERTPVYSLEQRYLYNIAMLSYGCIQMAAMGGTVVAHI